MTSLDALGTKVLAAMGRAGWVAGLGALATKEFKTIQVAQPAVAYLYPDDGYNNALTFSFWSEGRNVCSTATALIPLGSTDQAIEASVAAAVATAEQEIARSFAVRALELTARAP